LLQERLNGPAINLTIAIVQLKCHPSFRIGAGSYASEPFVDDEPQPCLQELRRHKFPVEELQQHCRDQYYTWHRARLESIIEWLKELEDEDFPDIIVFPEGSIPRTFLSCLQKKLYFRSKGPLIFAGTHAFEHSSKARHEYEQLEVDINTLAELGRLDDDLETVSVMPVLYPDRRVDLFPKLLLSPSERTAIGRKAAPPSQPSRIVEASVPRLGNQKIKVQTFVCSEALQYTGMGARGTPDLAAILSYDRKPSRFAHLAQQLVDNQIPVVYCNDGAFGGSGVYSPQDRRVENWLAHPPHHGQLPAGDGIAIVDVAIRSNAPEMGVNNPRLTHSMLRLCSVVPENVSSSPWRISSRVAELRRQIEQCIAAGKSVDTLNVATTITNLLQSESPTAIQQLQLDRLLELARDGCAALREWRVFGSDCRITQKHYKHAHRVLSRFNVVAFDNNRARAQGISFTPPSLDALEEELAAYCHHRISMLLDIPESRDHSALLRTRRRLEERVHSGLRGSPTEALRTLFHQVTRDAVRTARLCLTNLLGGLVEQFRATSGMLFIVQPDDKGGKKRLLANIMLNTPVREIERFGDAYAQGIVGRVAATEKAYLNSWVSSEQAGCDSLLDPYYRVTIPSTRAEVAVPIFAPTIEGSTTELIGVLNLESRIAGAFSPIQVPQIEAEASCLAMNMRIMQAASDPRRTLVWHPDVHGWGTKRILDHICYEIATSYSGGEHPPTISATIWYADNHKKRFYVRGTSRYDFEYISNAFLSFDSFLGHVLTTSNEGQVMRGAVDDLPQFRRPRKALRMELARVAAARFHAHRQIPTGQRSSEGIIALYSFRHELGVSEADFDIAFTDSRIRTLANQVGAAIGDILELRTQAGLSYLHARLASSAAPGVDEFAHVRDCLCEIFEADAATSFIHDDGALRVASTTGLEASTQEYVLHDDQLPTAGTPKRGLTRYLASVPRRVLRKVDVPDPSEPCFDAIRKESVQILPENIKREKGAVSRSEHRRFLGASLGSGGELAGVVRLIRSESSRPFVESDEELLASAVRVCEPVFSAHRERIRFIQGRSVFSDELQKFRIGASEPPDSEHPLDRIIFGSYQSIGSVRRLDSWLQDYRRVVAGVAAGHEAALTHIRYAFQDDRLEWQLQILAYHSIVSKYHHTDDEVYPRHKGNIGWKTIDRSHSHDLTADHAVIVCFNSSNCPLYDCGWSEQDLMIQSGVCVPLTWQSDGKIVQGVVSIDFNDLVTFDAHQIRDIFLCSHSLSAQLISPGTLQGHALRDGDISIAEWLKSVSKDFTWCALIPDARTTSSAVELGNVPSTAKKALRSPRPSRNNRWDVRSRWVEEINRMGVAQNERVLSCPLRVGPFAVFQFVGELTKGRYEELLANTDKEVKLRGVAGNSVNKRVNIEKSLGPHCTASGQFPEQSFRRRECAAILSTIAAHWCAYCSIVGSFWQTHDVHFKQIQAAMPDEEGLTLWDAEFVTRTRTPRRRDIPKRPTHRKKNRR
jgi:hypothetical protein